MDEGEHTKEKLEGPHIRGKLGGVYFRLGKQGIFQISYQNDKGKEVRESAHTTDEAKASRLLEARRRNVIKCQETGEIFEAPKLRKQTISECLDQWETQCRLRHRWNDTYAHYKKQLVERFGSMAAGSITKSVIQEYQLQEKQGCDEKQSLSRNSQLNSHLAVLTAAMKAAGVTPTYYKDASTLRLPEPPARQGYFTPQQFAILHRELPPDMADVAEALWLTGWRVSEIVGRKILGTFRPGVLWSEKDGDSLLLPGERTKGRKAKRVPLTGQLKALIAKRERLKFLGSDLIFHRGNGRPITEFNTVSAKWKRACIAAGRPGALIHDLRRSRARNWIRAGVSEQVAMRIGGWRTRQIFDRYDVVDEADMIRAQEKTEEYLQKQMEKQVAPTQISTRIN